MVPDLLLLAKALQTLGEKYYIGKEKPLTLELKYIFLDLLRENQSLREIGDTWIFCETNKKNPQFWCNVFLSEVPW